MINFSDINREDLIGAVHLDGQWYFFLEYLAGWIMDYHSYDPGSDPEDPRYKERNPRFAAPPGFVFRNHMYVINETNARDFISYLRKCELSPDDIKTIVEGKLIYDTYLTIVVDFDRRLFVSFIEVPIENYVPSGWTGVADDPLKYIPPEINIWLSLGVPLGLDS